MRLLRRLTRLFLCRNRKHASEHETGDVIARAREARSQLDRLIHDTEASARALRGKP